MSSIHSEMKKFYEKVKLDPQKKKWLRESRNNVRESIRQYFKKSDNYNIPKFYVQGSMSMGTTIEPIDGEFDIDDGVYINFKEIDYKNKNTWPCANEIHQLVEQAAEPKRRNVEDKNNCVRVTYAKDYHIDFPVYIKDFEDENFTPYLAVKDKGWILSDPLANTNYYKDKENQFGLILNRLIVYLKAIKDCYSHKQNIKLPLSGFEITLLVCKYINGVILNRDDEKVLYDVLKNIVQNLKSDTPLIKPVTKEDLWNIKKYSDKNTVMEFFENTLELLTQAINEEDKDTALAISADLFGDRFYKKKNGQIFPFGSLFHRLKMLWKYESKEETIDISATYKKSENAVKVYSYNNQLLNKKSLIYFKANVKNVKGDFEIKWQITNTGKQAAKDNDLRGEFYDSDKDKYTRSETTLYRGSHIVQGFVIQNGICVAKSKELVVNVS